MFCGIKQQQELVEKDTNKQETKSATKEKYALLEQRDVFPRKSEAQKNLKKKS